MKNKQMLSFCALAMIGIIGVSLVAANPHGGLGFKQMLSEEELQDLQEQKDAVREAIENQDYDTWASLMQERIVKMQESITEENFNIIVEMHEERTELHEEIKAAKESGDREAVKELREEMGFFGKMKHRFFKQ